MDSTLPPGTEPGLFLDSSLCQEELDSNSNSPVDFEDELEDADVDELLLRKQLLLSALNQCHSSETLLPVIELPDELDEDEEENELRNALLNSLKPTDVTSKISTPAMVSIESDLREALLDNQNAPSSFQPGPSVTRVVSLIEDRPKLSRQPKVKMSLQEMASSTIFAPTVEPVVIPLGDDSSSDEDSKTDKPLQKSFPVEPPKKVPRISAPFISQLDCSELKKDFVAMKRAIAVKQADVARAEQLVDHFKLKLCNAEKILNLNRQQLKMFKDREATLMEEIKRSMGSTLETKHKEAEASAKFKSKAANNGLSFSIESSDCKWLAIDEFFPLFQLQTVASLRKAMFKENSNQFDSENSLSSLRWSLLMQDHSPNLDSLRSSLFTNFFHAVLCPYDLSGVCKDRKCPYEHVSELNNPDWFLLRLIGLCPKALGLSEADLKDKQIVKKRISSVLAKFKSKSGRDVAKKEQLVHFIWNIVRSALKEEHSNSNGNGNKKFNLSYRISQCSRNDDGLSILGDEDLNRVVSSISSGALFKKDVERFSKSSVAQKLRTLCQILKCRADFSISAAVIACFSEFTSVSELCEVADFLMDNPFIFTTAKASSSQSVLAGAVCKLNLLLTAYDSQLSEEIEKLLKRIEKHLLPEDLIYFQLIAIQAVSQSSVHPAFIFAIFKTERPLFITNWSVLGDWQVLVEKMLTNCVANCQRLVAHLQQPFISQLVFCVLAQALSYRLFKSQRDQPSDKAQKLTERFYSKLCAENPRFDVALTSFLAFLYSTNFGPDKALDFIENSTVVSTSTRCYPSICYMIILLKLSTGNNVAIPDSHSLNIHKPVDFNPLEGLGVVGISEHFFTSLLVAHCNKTNLFNSVTPIAMRNFAKSVFASKLSENMIVTLSFCIRAFLADPKQQISEAVALNIVNLYFYDSQDKKYRSIQRLRLQSIAFSLLCCLQPEECSFVNGKMMNHSINLIEHVFDATNLSNGFILNRLIDTMKQQPALDLTYLAGLACRISCEYQQQEPNTSRISLSLPCDDAVVRLISLLSSPITSSASPQTKAVVIHTAFRLASCCLIQHPYDIRLWKLLFGCQRCLSSKFDPMDVYGRILTQLGLNMSS